MNHTLLKPAHRLIDYYLWQCTYLALFVKILVIFFKAVTMFEFFKNQKRNPYGIFSFFNKCLDFYRGSRIHAKIIEQANSYDYAKVEGVCFGSTIFWIQAELVRHQHTILG